jgi:hypothetical protein
VHSATSGARHIGTLFFTLRWVQYGLHQKRAGTHYAELLFLHPVGSVGHVVHSGACGARNVDALFSMLRWDQYGFKNKRNIVAYNSKVKQFFSITIFNT